MKIFAAVFTFTIIALALRVNGQPVTGVHFDVEPASLPGGATGNAAPFIALMQKLKAVTSGVTKLSADIPMGMGPAPLGAWNYNGRPIAYYIADIVDTVTLMAYRDHAAPTNGIIDHAQDFLNYAKQIGKQVVVGVETNCGLGDVVSFCEEGASYMETQLGMVQSTLSSYGAAFGGLAVHDYTGYSALAGSMTLPSSSPCRGLWVWTHSVVTDPNAQATFINFCQRMRVCTVYIESQGLVDSNANQPKLRSFVLALYAKGIQTELLFGNADWTYTQNQGQAVALAQATVNFIKSLPSSSGGNVNPSTTAAPVAQTTGAHGGSSTTGQPNNNNGGCGQKVVQKRYRITDGNDDVEQQLSDNNYMYCTSSDLEMTKDGSISQVIGMRFKNIDISPQDTIVDAYLEMKAKVAATTTTNLVIQGERNVNGDVLCNQALILTNRPHTIAQVAWPNVPHWKKNQVYQSPDISPIVKEVVGLGGWNSGNPMTFFVSGSGMRNAISYNGGEPPYLVVNVKTVICGQDYGYNQTNATTDWWGTENEVPATADDSRDFAAANQLPVAFALSAIFAVVLLLL